MKGAAPAPRNPSRPPRRWLLPRSYACRSGVGGTEVASSPEAACGAASVANSGVSGGAGAPALGGRRCGDSWLSTPSFWTLPEPAVAWLSSSTTSCT